MSPVYLQAPDTYRPGGPDGQGWNRLSLNAHMGTFTSRCALRPRTYAGLVESRNTFRARWGSAFAACLAGGACRDCAVLNAPATTFNTWDGEDGRVLVRERERGIVDDLVPGGVPSRLHLMQDAAAGWDSRSVVWTWEQVSRLQGWSIGRRFRDEHSEGFWLIREAPPTDPTSATPAQLSSAPAAESAPASRSSR